MVESAPHSDPTAYLFSLAKSMRESGLDSGEVHTRLLAMNLKRCQPPVSEDEVGRIADQAFEADLRGSAFATVRTSERRKVYAKMSTLRVFLAALADYHLRLPGKLDVAYYEAAQELLRRKTYVPAFFTGFVVVLVAAGALGLTFLWPHHDGNVAWWIRAVMLLLCVSSLYLAVRGATAITSNYIMWRVRSRSLEPAYRSATGQEAVKMGANRVLASVIAYFPHKSVSFSANCLLGATQQP